MRFVLFEETQLPANPTLIVARDLCGLTATQLVRGPRPDEVAHEVGADLSAAPETGNGFPKTVKRETRNAIPFT